MERIPVSWETFYREPADCIEKSGKPPRRQKFVSKDSYATTSSEDRAEERLAGGTRNSVRRETSSNLFFVCQEFDKMQYTKIKRTATEIQDLVKTPRKEYRTESVIADLSKTGEFNRFSEESKKTVQILGKIELFDLGEVSKNIQCSSCAKYWPEGLLYCICRICLMPSTEQKRKIKNQFDILSIPVYIVKKGFSPRRSMDFPKSNMIT